MRGLTEQGGHGQSRGFIRADRNVYADDEADLPEGVAVFPHERIVRLAEHRAGVGDRLADRGLRLRRGDEGGAREAAQAREFAGRGETEDT